MKERKKERKKRKKEEKANRGEKNNKGQVDCLDRGEKRFIIIGMTVSASTTSGEREGKVKKDNRLV